MTPPAPPGPWVLTYWLEALKLEAAAQVGVEEVPPPPAGAPFDPDLAHPSEEGGHALLPLGEDAPWGLADLLVRRADEVRIAPLDARHVGLFERDLPARLARGDRADPAAPWADEAPMFALGFPVIGLREGGRRVLAPLLEVPVRLVWLDEDGLPWRLPERRDRRGGDGAAPPAALALVAADPEPAAPWAAAGPHEAARPSAAGEPWLVNRRLLDGPLGLEPDAVDGLLEWLADRPGAPAEDVLVALAAVIATGGTEILAELDPPDAPPEALLEGLARAVQRALRGAHGARVAPAVLLFEASTGSPTAGLQRELRRVAARWDEGPPPAPLAAWLGDAPAQAPWLGDAPAQGPRLGDAPAQAPARGPHRGLLSGRPLTPAQAEAVERAAAEPLVAVEGPPGTGKTELIVDLAADLVVRNALAGVYADRGPVPVETLAVLSQNNQAVDQALAPLLEAGDPPLALRLGNRRVMERRAARSLDRVANWLASDLAEKAAEEHERSIDALHHGSERLEAALGAGAGPEALAPLRQALLRAALDARRAWAGRRRHDLLTLLRARVDARERPRWQPSWLEDEAARPLAEALFPVVGTTLLSLGHAWPLARGVVGLVVVDEAGQAPPAHAVPALYRARRALVIGDVHQLEPIVGLTPAEEARLFERVAAGEPPSRAARFRLKPRRPASVQRVAEAASPRVVRLDRHFRCQAPIIAISSRLAGYRLEVATPPADLSHVAAALDAPVLLLPVEGGQSRWGRSQQHPEEAHAVAALVADLLAEGVDPGEIGVVTPYRGQLRLLRRLLREAGVPLADWEGDADAGSVLTGTIHRLQGGERDVVVLSTVAREAPSLRWLDGQPNLLNVGVSRARLHLVVAGDRSVLARGRHTRELLVDAIPLAPRRGGRLGPGGR